MPETVNQPAYTRRRVMTGMAAAASAAVPGVVNAAAPIDNYDEIAMLIDQYREIEERRDAVNREIDRVLVETIQPEPPMVRVVEVVEREMDYPPALRNLVLSDREEIDVSFNQHRDHARRMIDIADFPPSWVERIDRDMARAHDLLAQRKRDYSAWRVASGFGALEEEDDALYNLRVEVCERICQIKCLSLRDVNAKATFAIGVLHPADQLEEAAPDILKSMVISLPSASPQFADGMPRAR